MTDCPYARKAFANCRFIFWRPLNVYYGYRFLAYFSHLKMIEADDDDEPSARQHVCPSYAVSEYLCLMSGLERELVSTGECSGRTERADLRCGGQRPAQLRPWRGRLLAL